MIIYIHKEQQIKKRKEVSNYEKQKNRENRDKKSMGKLLGQKVQRKKRISE